MGTALIWQKERERSGGASNKAYEVLYSSSGEAGRSV